MSRKPIPCKKCGVFLSGKARNEIKSNPSGASFLCNNCSGIGYNPSASVGRKILWKKKK